MTDDELVSLLLDADEHAGGGTRYQDAADAITKLRAERDALAANLAAARALLREWRECDEAGRHPECNAESWRPWRREIAAKVDAALAGEKNNGAS